MPFWLKKIEFGLQVFCSKWKKAFKCSRVMAHTVQLMNDAYGPVHCSITTYIDSW